MIFGCAGSSVRARAFSSCGKRGPLSIAVRGPLLIAVRGPFTIAAPPAAGHRLQTRRLSNCGSRAQPLRGMRDPPRPGLEPVSPALAGRFSTTAPPGKPGNLFLKAQNVNDNIVIIKKVEATQYSPAMGVRLSQGLSTQWKMTKLSHDGVALSVPLQILP